MAFELDQQKIADFVDTEVTPLQALWARVHAQAAELDPEAAAYDNEIRKLNPKHQNGFMAVSQKVCWVTSLKNPAKGIRAGRVFSCPPLLAAQLLVGGTHRLSEDAEIKGWHVEQENRREEARVLKAAQTPPPPAAVQHIHLDPGMIQALRDMPASGQGKSHGGAKPAQE